MKLDELRNLMIGYRISPQGPLLNAPLDDEDRQELSAAFLRSAEIGNRPWASIAIDDWLQAGKWWLLKVRSQMNRLAEGTEIKAHAYVNLLKACWILADIVSIHPQRVHLVKKGYEDKSSRSEFLVRDCIDVEFLPPETFVWKVICWHCKRFADMKLLLEGFYIMLRLHDPLIQSAFLRLDRHFLDQMEYYLNQIVHYLNHRDGWCPDDVLIMVKAALRSNDAGYLLWILEHVNAATLSDHQTAIFQLVYNSRRLGHIDAMIQVIVPRPADIAAALAWYLSSSDEQSFGDFLHMVEVRGGYFKGKTTEEIDLSNFYPAFVAGCGRLIETQRPNTLSIYLDSLEKLAYCSTGFTLPRSGISPNPTGTRSRNGNYATVPNEV
ncbi:hypothetical protein FVER53263_20435 [Fusarium verticillioides]|nr:hypothetical protein FVER53263_20435 [Fusarium verticillioides]